MKTPPLIEPLEARIAPALTAASVSLGSLTGANGFSIHGAVDLDEAGTSVSAAGDVNGDGYDDVIVGARFANEGGSDRGAAYVIFGGEGGFPTTFDLTSLGERGYEIIGVADSDFTGQSVHAAGDVNGDGFDDLIVGAQYANEGGINRGVAYVIFGHAGLGPDVTLANLNGTDGFKLQGIADNDNAGRSVSAAGDVNHDGFDDILVGAPFAKEGGSGRGAAYVVFGRDVWNAAVSLGSLNGSNGFKIPGVADGQNMGNAVSSAGDVNGDGFDDILIGSFHAAGGGADRGAAYLIFGKHTGFTASFDVTTLNGTNGGVFNGVGDSDEAGASVNSAGDVNGDGYGDFVIGAPLSGGVNNVGSAYVVFGKSTPFAAANALGGLTGSNGFALIGTTKNTNTGTSVSGLGDLNGDGYGDLIVGADSVGGGTGAAYVVYGKASGFTQNFPLTTLDGLNGFSLTGIDLNDNAGRSVSGAGDVNHDGYADLIVGAPKAEAGGGSRGSAYVVFGGPSGTQVQPTISTDGKTATFTELDGDLVTVKITKGKLTSGQFDLLQPAGADGARFLQLFFGAAHQLSDVTITAKPTAAGGNGLVDLGLFKSDGFDLGTVKIGGNVESFVIGDGANATPAVKTLSVQSLGRSSLPAQDTDGPLAAGLNGKAGSLVVKGDVDGVYVTVGELSNLTIGGSLLGGLREYFGSIHSNANVGTVKIAHDVIGKGENTGAIVVAGKLKNLAIGGSILGGAGGHSGDIYVSNGLGAVTVGHDIVDGSIGGNKAIGKVTVGGSIRGTLPDKYSGITTQGPIGSVLVKGDIEGTTAAPVLLYGRGLDVAGSKTNLAIGAVTVLGSVSNAMILAGYDQDAVAVDGHSQIGKVTVGGDWTASSIAIGVKIGNAPDFLHYANADDALSAGGQSAAAARIASIVIKGAVHGTPGGNDHFGFVAHEIGALQIGAVKYKLTKGGGNDLLDLGATNDFSVREV